MEETREIADSAHIGRQLRERGIIKGSGHWDQVIRADGLEEMNREDEATADMASDSTEPECSRDYERVASARKSIASSIHRVDNEGFRGLNRGSSDSEMRCGREQESCIRWRCSCQNSAV